MALWSAGHCRAIHRPVFDPSFFSPSGLSDYLAALAGFPHPYSNSPYKPHSLRIGGHTFYTVHGMNPDLRDFLARRAVARCSLRYYRASPANNLRAIRAFYGAIDAAAHGYPTHI